MKTFKFFLTSIFLLCCSVMQAEVIDGINYSLNSYAKTAAVSSSSNRYSGDIRIPETVEYNGVTYNVTSIGSGAFEGCTSLTSIALPDGLTSIGDQAFCGCSSLTSIDLPDGLTSIGGSAFYGCSSLTSINLPDGLTSIRGCAFASCSSLTSIDLPDGITNIEERVFTGCSSLTSIDLPDGLTRIGNEAFYGCSSLDRIYLRGENPFTYNSNSYLFDKNRAIIVPESAIDTYCKAEGWSDNAKYITGTERMSQSIEVTASNSGSSVRTAIGDDKVADVVDLKIKGTINSYDIIVLNQKMPILHNLDLSEAQIVACDYPYNNVSSV